jgi:hypothetical protein
MKCEYKKCFSVDFQRASLLIYYIVCNADIFGAFTFASENFVMSVCPLVTTQELLS